MRKDNILGLIPLIIIILLSNCRNSSVLQPEKTTESKLFAFAINEGATLCLNDIGKNKGLNCNDEICIYSKNNLVAKYLVYSVSDNSSFCRLAELYGKKNDIIGNNLLISYIAHKPNSIKQEKVIESISIHLFPTCGTIMRQMDEVDPKIKLFCEVLDSSKTATKTKGGKILVVSEERAVIMLGEQHGVQLGDVFYVYRNDYLLGKILINLDIGNDCSNGSIADDSDYIFEMGDDVTIERKDKEKTMSDKVEKQFKRRIKENKK
jgi:hypothetical protein